MFGFHAWDLLMLPIFVGVIALVVGLVFWAVRRRTKMIEPMGPQQPYSGQASWGPGQFGTQPPDPGVEQQPNQYPGHPPAQHPPQ
jgi:hypothetical protein